MGGTVDVGTGQSYTNLNSTDPAYRPVIIPLGDINGDGFADFIKAISANIFGSNTLVRVSLGGRSNEDITGPGLLDTG